MRTLTPSRRWVAILLSLIGPGLGHFSLGRWQRGLVWLATVPILALLGTLSVHAMTLAVVVRIASVIDCVWVTRRAEEPCDVGRGVGLVATAAVCAFVLSLGLRMYVVEMFTAASGSSQPTLEVGDWFVVDRLAGLDAAPTAGSLIVFKHPCYAEIMYVSRVVALPGQVVDVDANGFLMVDGQPTAGNAKGAAAVSGERPGFRCPLTTYANTIGGQAFETLHCADATPPSPSRAPANDWSAQTQYRACGQMGAQPAVPYPWRVPEGHVFTLSDNRPNAADGRFWGFVPFALILGPVEGVWWHAGSGPALGHASGLMVRRLLLGW